MAQQFVANTASTPGSPLIASLLNGLVQSTSYVLSGGNPGTSASLSITVPQTQAVVLVSTGIALWANVASTPLTLTASRDTYLDLVVSPTAPYAGSLAFTGPLSVANGAATPALTANSVRLCKVVTSGTAATSVVDLRPLTPQATAPGLRQLQTGVQISNAALSGSTLQNWPGTGPLSLTTQPGGNLRVRVTIPLTVTTSVAAQLAEIDFFLVVDGTILPSGSAFLARTDSTAVGYQTAAIVWITAVPPGPHTLVLRARLMGTTIAASGINTGMVCLEVEEYA